MTTPVIVQHVGRIVEFTPAESGITTGLLTAVGQCGYPRCQHGTGCVTIRVATRRGIATINRHVDNVNVTS